MLKRKHRKERGSLLNYEIREICGDWAIYEVWKTERKSGERCLHIFNSWVNAEYVKAILEHEARYPNAAVPYSPEVADMSDEEVLAIFRLCTDNKNYGCLGCPLCKLDECYKFIDARVIAIIERVLGDKHE